MFLKLYPAWTKGVAFAASIESSHNACLTMLKWKKIMTKVFRREQHYDTATIAIPLFLF